MEIYLDNAATTPVHSGVMRDVSLFSTNNYGNASSQHALGRKVKEEIDAARKKIALSLDAKPEEIIFTSGGTESNNIAIKGLIENPENKTKKHIITSNIEHPAVLEICKKLETRGFKVTYIPTNEEGLINPQDIKKAIRKDTLLVSIMHVNNEIGTIQPLEEIGKICKTHNVYFHSDCVQSFGKLNIDVNKMNLDLLSASGHKFNAPKGIGFLYVRNNTLISPIIEGGGHEKGLRPGTLNSPGIISLSSALKIRRNKREIEKTRNLLIKELLKIPKSKLNGSQVKRIYNNINISFYGIEGESLMLMLDKKGVIVSTGSACASNKLQESHVLKAIKVSDLYIHGSLRLTLDTIKPLKKQEIIYIIKSIEDSVNKLRDISPFKISN
jgi:cysteine desulfurase